MSAVVIVWGFTFESFLIEDDGVVLWCLCQAEKLTAETKQEKKRAQCEKELCYSFNGQ